VCNILFWDGMMVLMLMGWFGCFEEVVVGVVYFVSDDVVFIIGFELYIDGGYIVC